jgi:DNA-binding IscR family transcriptional regulator
MRAPRKDWTMIDAMILTVLRRAGRPLRSREIKQRGAIPPLHFDVRLQALKHRGLIVCEGRTMGGRWTITG